MPLPIGDSILCLITDRHRLPPIGRNDSISTLLLQIAIASAAGIDLVQIRERDLEARDLLRLVRQCVEETRGTTAQVVVNDRTDVALSGGAAGVHLRSDSIPAPRVRQLAPSGFLIGRSIHSPAEAAEAERRGGVDYLIAGTLFPTRSKPVSAPPLGLDGLAEILSATALPVLAIGGITLETIPAVARVGAAGFAAIGLFAGSPTAGDSAAFDRQVGDAVRRARALFDRSAAVP
jgi:thiamine-phosphate pyrophosphorylase